MKTEDWRTEDWGAGRPPLGGGQTLGIANLPLRPPRTYKHVPVVASTAQLWRASHNEVTSSQEHVAESKRSTPLSASAELSAAMST